jgi:hypothetical protein
MGNSSEAKEAPRREEVAESKACVKGNEPEGRPPVPREEPRRGIIAEEKVGGRAEQIGLSMTTSQVDTRICAEDEVRSVGSIESSELMKTQRTMRDAMVNKAQHTVNMSIVLLDGDGSIFGKGDDKEAVGQWVALRFTYKGGRMGQNPRHGLK